MSTKPLPAPSDKPTAGRSLTRDCSLPVFSPGHLAETVRAAVTKRLAGSEETPEALAPFVMQAGQATPPGSELAGETGPAIASCSHDSHDDRFQQTWTRLRNHLEVAEQQAAWPMATRLARWFPGPVGWPFRAAIACGRWLVGWLNRPQVRFNRTLLDLLRDWHDFLPLLHAALKRSGEKAAEQESRLRQLEHGLHQSRTALLDQGRRLTMLLEEARRRLPEPFSTEQVQAIADEANHSLDALYIAFEDIFRGSRETIKERLRVYLPILRAARVGGEQMPILDLGCGRGEWLELLAEQGWHARGLDSNRVMVEECRQRGLAVSEGDVLAHLRSLPDASLGAVTAFHVLEHLPLEVLLRFLDETARVLRPGGIAIFETPNPENLVVGGCDFYRDPTHQRPLHPDTVQFLVEQRGLVRVEILRLSEHRIQDPLQLLPWHHSLAAYLNPLIDRAKRHFFGPTDYAVIGRKAGEAQALR